MLVKSNILNLDDLSRIDTVIGGDHGRGAFRCPMKLIYVMKSSNFFERESSVAYFLCKKNNGEILKNTIIHKLQDSLKLILEIISIDNHQVSIDNLYVTGDLVFLVILLGKVFSSPKGCFKCKLYSKL